MEKTIKAWAVTTSHKSITGFAPLDIFKVRLQAKQAAEAATKMSGTKRYFIPCTITYTLPAKNKKL